MNKLVTISVLAGTLFAAAAPSAQARGISPLGAVAIGVAGAAVVGSAVAASNGYYGPVYGVAPAYGYGECYVTRRAFVDPYGYTYFRRVRVCD